MKMTVVINESGEVVAAVRTGRLENNVELRVHQSRSHRHHDVDVPEELLQRPPSELHERLIRLISNAS